MSVISGFRQATIYDPSNGDTVQFARLHGETQAQVRNIADTDETDANGQPYFAGYDSSMTLVSADLTDITQLEAWLTANERIRAVAIGFQRNVQWYEDDRILSQTEFGDGPGEIDVVSASMSRMSDAASHAIYGNVNLLQFAGWRGSDEDSNGVPDEYTNDGFTGVDFTDADGDGTEEQFEGFAPTGGGEASLYKDVVLPIPGAPLTLSALFNQLHDDGTTYIEVQTLDFADSVLQTETETVSATGRASVSVTTHADTYKVRCKVVKVDSASANTSKAEVADPALRVDGSEVFVQY